MDNKGAFDLGESRAEIDANGIWKSNNPAISTLLNAMYAPVPSEAGVPWITAFSRAAQDLGGKITMQPIASPYPPESPHQESVDEATVKHGAPPRPGLEFDESIHHWVRPESSEAKPDDAKPASSDEPTGVWAKTLSRAGAIIAAGAGVASAAVQKAKELGSAAMAKIEARYGSKVKRAVQVAVLASLPLPVPGMSVLLSAPIIAFAELLHQLSGKPAQAAGKAYDDEADASAHSADGIDTALVKQLADEVLAELFGGTVPEELKQHRQAQPQESVVTKGIGALGRSGAVSIWTDQHAQHEGRIAAAAQNYLTRYAASIRSHADPAMAFDPDTFADGYHAAVSPVLLNAAGAGSRLGTPALHATEAENAARVAATEAFDQTFFWMLADNLHTDLKAAASNPDALNPLSDEAIRNRAALLGTTEATGALSMGQDAARQVLTEAGVPVRKQWVCLLDGNERPSHREAHGQIVAADEPFMVGGFPADHPGDMSLPVEERARCRCWCRTIYPQDDGVAKAILDVATKSDDTDGEFPVL